MKGRYMIGAGAAFFGGVGAIGGLTGGWKSSSTSNQEDEGSFLSTLGVGLGATALLGAAAISLPAALSGFAASKHLGAKGGWEVFKAQSKTAFRATAAPMKAMWGIHTDKKIIDEMRQAGAARNLKGLESTMLGRAFAKPAKFAAQKIESGVEHTADWLSQNWIPALKKGKPAAVGLAALGAYDMYGATKAAYEGDAGGVVGNIARFGAMKYAYMGIHYRKPITEWFKKQKLADWASYAGLGASALSSARAMGLEALQYHVAYTRTGTDVPGYLKSIAPKYGEEFLKVGRQAKEDFAAAAADMDPEKLETLMSHPAVDDAIKVGQRIGKQAEEAGIEANNMTEEAFRKSMEEAQQKARDVAPEIGNSSWLGQKAAEKFAEADQDQMYGAFNSLREGARKAKGAADEYGRGDWGELGEAYNRAKAKKKEIEEKARQHMEDMMRNRGNANNIEGFTEDGLAGANRKPYGFGSGWLGNIVGGAISATFKTAWGAAKLGAQGVTGLAKGLTNWKGMAQQYGTIGPKMQGDRFFRKAPSSVMGEFNKSPLAKIGKSIGTTVGKAALFTAEHPLLIGGTIGGAMAVGAVTSRRGQTRPSPTMSGLKVKTDYNQQAMQAESLNEMFVQTPGIMGSAPQYRQQMQRFQNSTKGLVQGLHRGRH